ncbi:MAG: carbamoyltransferase HypF [Anaerolineales bacterium]
MTQPAAYRILINGIVQGVGFRPFIYRIALENSLSGWVKNTSSGVEIEVAGSQANLENFITAIKHDAPPLSRIDSLQHQSIDLGKYDSFQIHHSQSIAGGFQPISPDVSICDDCLEELFTPDDFRYRYPFINCTNCGPRFTIIKDIPYDRPQTTMAEFDLCPTCMKEYQDPLDRRFHAQPVACPECGPQIWLELPAGSNLTQGLAGDPALLETQRLLTEGYIIGIKGLGGFHLACDGENKDAIQRLRERKSRPSKPLAVMMPTIEVVRNYCQVSIAEENLLSSPQRPILLLQKNPDSSLPLEIAPGQDHVGVMLPYTPLHYLLFSGKGKYPSSPYTVLVMTSANFSGNPILTENHAVTSLLNTIADAYLLHNRDIHIHCDDSVARVLPVQIDPSEKISSVRRSRGYAPQPIDSPFSGKSVLGTGSELKNTFCMTKNSYAFVSQHIGDLKNYETLTSYQETIAHFEDLFRVAPELIIHDLHPDYLSTRYALERSEVQGIPLYSAQHHHAHITSCLADNNYQSDEPVIGLAFDGVGYGDDGAIWGGEFLIANYSEYTRVGHLDYFPLPGGDQAIREPWRTALSLLHHYDIPWDSSFLPVQHLNGLAELLPGIHQGEVLKNQLSTGTNAPLTSSIGRLFDGVASILGICHQISYEGQAAIEFEALALEDENGTYPLEISDELIFNPGNMIRSILKDQGDGVQLPIISARFHNTLAEMVLEIALSLRQTKQLGTVALSGGVWQNMTLLKSSVLKLRSAGFQVLLHQQVPPNDGGLSLGQAVIGQKYLQV